LPGEEIANTVTHILGAALSIAALVLLVVFAGRTEDPYRMVSSIAFGSSLVFLYLASTLYHGLTAQGAKRIFKVFDHAGIYLLIAGSYTPFTLVTLRGPVGWTLFGIVWGLAVTGIVTELFWVDRPRWLSALVFIGMGWLVIFAVKPLAVALPQGGLRLLVAGGLAYTAGTVFYLAKSIPYMHAVWHLWVIGGSVCHVLAVLLYVL
jgi:hemolysin III